MLLISNMMRLPIAAVVEPFFYVLELYMYIAINELLKIILQIKTFSSTSFNYGSNIH